MNEPTSAGNLKRQRLILVAMVFVFAAPVVLSWLAFKYTEFGRDQENPGHGVLIQPPVQLPDLPLSDPGGTQYGLALHGKWNLVYLLHDECEVTCEENMYAMRQLRLALGDDTSRMQRVLFVIKNNNNVLSVEQQQEYNGQLILNGDSELLESFKMPGDVSPQEQDRLYLVDPRGFLFMYYPPGTGPKGIIKDLKRLLRYSRVG